MFSSASTARPPIAAANLAQARDRCALVENGHRDDQRQRRERERGEVGVEREHDDRGQQDRADILRQHRKAPAEERRDLSHVDRRARDQLADGLALENAQIQRMQVSEEAVSQVVLHLEPDATRDALAGPLRHGDHDRDPPDRKRRADEAASIARGDLVHRIADQQRNENDADDRAEREQNPREEPSAVGTEQGEELAERPAATSLAAPQRSSAGTAVVVSTTRTPRFGRLRPVASLPLSRAGS